jgi:hypothetical protein
MAISGQNSPGKYTKARWAGRILACGGFCLIVAGRTLPRSGETYFGPPIILDDLGIFLCGVGLFVLGIVFRKVITSAEFKALKTASERMRFQWTSQRVLSIEFIVYSIAFVFLLL